MFPKMQLLLGWKSIGHHTAGLLGGEIITPFLGRGGSFLVLMIFFSIQTAGLNIGRQNAIIQAGIWPKCWG